MPDPMDIDKGRAGIERSRWHPSRAPRLTDASRTAIRDKLEGKPTDLIERAAYDKIAILLPKGNL